MAPCEAQISYDGVFAIIKLKGTLEHDNVISVSAHGTTVLNKRYKKIIIDMADIVHANSKGLGSLISIMNQCTKNEAEFVLLNPNGKAMDVLTTTKLTQVFTIIKGTLDEAKKQFE